MLPTVIAMLVILAIAGVVVGMVVVGMEGAGRHRLPEVASTLARAGRHLNGDAEPPRGLVALFEEAEAGAEDLRHLPETLRARRSGSASSAASARSARTAPSAVSAASAPRPEEVDASSASAWARPNGRSSTWQSVAASGGPAASPSPLPAAQPARQSAWETWTPES